MRVRLPPPAPCFQCLWLAEISGNRFGLPTDNLAPPPPRGHSHLIGHRIPGGEALAASAISSSSPNRRSAGSSKATLYIRGSGSFVASATTPIATGWSDPVPGRDFQPAADQRLNTAHCQAIASQPRRFSFFRKMGIRFTHQGTISCSLCLDNNPAQSGSTVLGVCVVLRRPSREVAGQDCRSSNVFRTAASRICGDAFFDEYAAKLRRVANPCVDVSPARITTSWGVVSKADTDLLQNTVSLCAVGLPN